MQREANNGSDSIYCDTNSIALVWNWAHMYPWGKAAWRKVAACVCVCACMCIHMCMCVCACMGVYLSFCLAFNKWNRPDHPGKSREQPMIYSLFLFSHISKLNNKGRNVMTGELTHMEKVSDNSAHASEESRAERAEGHAWPRTSLCCRNFLPLKPRLYQSWTPGKYNNDPQSTWTLSCENVNYPWHRGREKTAYGATTANNKSIWSPATLNAGTQQNISYKVLREILSASKQPCVWFIKCTPCTSCKGESVGDGRQQLRHTSE